MSNKTKKQLLLNLPYFIAGLVCTNLGEAWRIAEGADMSEKLLGFLSALGAAFSNPMPSLHPMDLLIGVCCGAGLRIAVYLKGKNAKKYRHGMEYGSARWGTQKDIEPFEDPVFANNVILTRTERLMMGNRPKNPANARNKNVLVVGGSGSGKTRFWLKPNLLQCHSSYVVTDPKYGAKACDSHNLEARVLHEAVFADIQAHAKAAVSNREALVKKIANQMHLRVSSDRAQHKRDLKQCKARIAEIEDLYAKLYEDVSKGLLPEKRFQMLADRYDKEQAELTEKIEQYEREGRAEHDQLDKIQDFIDEVSKYAGITELNYKILHQLIDKILVSKAEKVDGEYVQKIQIFYRFIGPLDAIE